MWQSLTTYMYMLPAALLLSACNTTLLLNNKANAPSVNYGEYISSPITLSDGTIYTPTATSQSDCATLRQEDKKLDAVIGGEENFEAFLKRGDPEITLGKYKIKIAEASATKNCISLS